MAFTLNRITPRKAKDGSPKDPIVRSTDVEGDRIAIGRDSTNELRLSDLAAALHHAVIERTGGILVVRALPGLGFELGGRTVSEGEIDLAAGGTIRIARHVIEVKPAPADTDRVVIDMTKLAEGEAAERADVRRFALATVLPAKRPLAWALIVLVLAVFLAWPIWSFYQRDRERELFAEGRRADHVWLSGSLTSAHKGLSCTACHTDAFVSVRDRACMSCHADGLPLAPDGHSPPVVRDHAPLHLQAMARPDLDAWGRVRLRFQRAFNLPAGRCVDCHTEHEGPQTVAVATQQFCTDCHAELVARLPRDRRTAELGNVSDFGRPETHPEFRPLVLTDWGGRPQRVSLAASRRELSHLTFPHEVHLRPLGGAAQMGRRLQSRFGAQLECADCHVPVEGRADAQGASFRPVNMESNCSMCHSLVLERAGGRLRMLPHGDPDRVTAAVFQFYRSRVSRPAELSEAARRQPGAVIQIRAAVRYARARAGADARAVRAVHATFSRRGACADCHRVEAPPRGSLRYRIAPFRLQSRYIEHGWFDHSAHERLVTPEDGTLNGPQACNYCHRADRSESSADLLIPARAVCAGCHIGERRFATMPERERRPAHFRTSCAMCHDYHADFRAGEGVQHERTFMCRERPALCRQPRTASAAAAAPPARATRR